MTNVIRLEKFKAPLGGQEIELQQIDYEGSNCSQLRTRIRERSRFTVFDVDPVTAKYWGMALLRWAEEQETRAVHAPLQSTVPEQADTDADNAGRGDG
jgi:hypothetical protein